MGSGWEDREGAWQAVAATEGREKIVDGQRVNIEAQDPQFCSRVAVRFATDGTNHPTVRGDLWLLHAPPAPLPGHRSLSASCALQLSWRAWAAGAVCAFMWRRRGGPQPGEKSNDEIEAFRELLPNRLIGRLIVACAPEKDGLSQDEIASVRERMCEFILEAVSLQPDLPVIWLGARADGLPKRPDESDPGLDRLSVFQPFDLSTL